MHTKLSAEMLRYHISHHTEDEEGNYCFTSSHAGCLPLHMQFLNCTKPTTAISWAIFYTHNLHHQGAHASLIKKLLRICSLYCICELPRHQELCTEVTVFQGLLKKIPQIKKLCKITNQKLYWRAPAMKQMTAFKPERHYLSSQFCLLVLNIVRFPPKSRWAALLPHFQNPTFTVAPKYFHLDQILAQMLVPVLPLDSWRGNQALLWQHSSGTACTASLILFCFP